MGRRAAAFIIAIALSAAAVSCRDVFTGALGAAYVRSDLVMAWLLRPEGPAVTFTSPAGRRNGRGDQPVGDRLLQRAGHAPRRRGTLSASR